MSSGVLKIGLLDLLADGGGDGLVLLPGEAFCRDRFAENDRHIGRLHEGKMLFENIIRMHEGHRNNGRFRRKSAPEAAFMEGQQTVQMASCSLGIDPVGVPCPQLFFHLFIDGQAGAQALSVQEGAVDKFHKDVQDGELAPFHFGQKV